MLMVKVQSRFFYGILRDNGCYHPRSIELKAMGAGIRSSDQTRKFLSIRLEFKDFRFQVTEDGKSISITEITRGGSYRINIDFKVADWVSRELKKAVSSMGERWFVSKYQSSTALMLLQKYCNDRGVFISLMELKRGTVCRVIIFPACKNGEGWVKVADALREVVNGRVYFQMIRNETGAIRERRYMPNDQLKSQIHSQSENQIRWGKVNRESKGTFAEVLRKQSISNVYEKQKTTRVKEGLDGVFKWDKVFVCTKESLWHKWSTIEEAFNRRFKMGISLIPFQPDKAVIQCKAEKK
ncbi:hypothetical protein LguiB_020788 [Lonicera macranthoides]